MPPLPKPDIFPVTHLSAGKWIWMQHVPHSSALTGYLCLVPLGWGPRHCGRESIFLLEMKKLLCVQRCEVTREPSVIWLGIKRHQVALISQILLEGKFKDTRFIFQFIYFFFKIFHIIIGWYNLEDRTSSWEQLLIIVCTLNVFVWKIL